LLLQATAAAEKAKAAVGQNASSLRSMTDRKDAMLSTLDHAKMQEAMNAAEERMTSTLGDTVPTVAEVQRKIDARLAKARARSELLASQVVDPDPAMLEVEQAQISAAAQARLSAMRVQLGLPLSVVSNEPRELPAPRVEQDKRATR